MRRFISGVGGGLALVGLLIAAPAGADETGTKVSVGTKGLQVETADGDFRFNFGGRIHADATLHVGDTPGNNISRATGGCGVIPGAAQQPNCDATDGTEIRRARLYAKATLYKNWFWIGEVDFADNEAAVKDFFVGYKTKGLTLNVGHQKMPYSLDQEMSSNDFPFTERGIDNTLVVAVLDRAIGVRGDAWGENWFFAAGFYGDSMEPDKDNAMEGWGTAAKFVVTPIREESSVVHIGFRGAMRRPESGNETARFRDETTHMSDYSVVDTGTLQNIQEIALFGPEAAVAFGPVSLWGEYNRMHITRKKSDSVEFESGYVAAAISLTGESRAASYTIKSAEWKRLKPNRNFDLNGGFGAWELAARYSYVSVNDGSLTSLSTVAGAGPVYGGREQVFTAALNWYVNPVIRFQFNWNYIIDTHYSDVVGSSSRRVFNQEGKGLNNFTLRAQFAF